MPVNKTSKIKKLFFKIIFLIVACSFQILKAQNQPLQAIKTPNVSSLERFGNIPVNLFTGTPDISIPIYQIESGNIKIPINLRYHASSVKPNQSPGWVGLGWDLECTGAITRQVRGAYDEFDYSSGVLTLYKNYLSTGANNVESNSGWLVPKNIYDTYYDYNYTNGDQEADEFNFNFLGHSGKFYYSGSSKGWVVVSNEKIKVEINGLLSPTEIFNNALSKYSTYEPNWYSFSRFRDYLATNQTKFIKEFTLITPDGTRYTFGGIDAAEFTTRFTSPSTGGDVPYKDINLTSWLLKKIVDSNGKTITYNYIRNFPSLSLSYYSSSFSSSQADTKFTWLGWTGYKGSSSASSSQLINPYQFSGSFVFPMYLETINSDIETVSFVSSPAITLGYTDAQFSGGGHQWDHSGEDQLWKNNLKWNKLTSLDIKDKVNNRIVKIYSFEYFENSNQRFALSKLNVIGSDLVNYEKYEFQYNDIAGLPLYGGNYTDHWGFFNGKNIRSTLETAFDDRQTISDLITKGLLTQIKYPTGGTTSFSWEAYKHSKVLAESKDRLNDYLGYAGGSRISEIKSYTDLGVLASQKKYYYISGYNSFSDPNNLPSSGVLNGIPRYTYKFNNYQGGYNGKTYFSLDIFNLNSFTNSNPTGNGSHIGYDEVVEVNMDKSYTKHFFTNFGSDLNGIPHYDIAPLASTGWKIADQSVYMPFSSLEEERGKEIATWDYNSKDILVKKVKNVFRNDTSRFLDYVKQKLVSNNYGSSTSGDALMFAVAIKNFTYNYYLISQEVTNYDLIGLNPITTIKNFSYNSNSQMSEEILTNSKNEQVSAKYFYPQDFVTEPFMQQLVNANRIILPVSTEKYLFSNMFFKSKTVYANDATTGDLVLPKNDYAAKFPNYLPSIPTSNLGQLEKKITYDQYDTNGSLLQYTPENGQPVTILWGYGKTQPIAKIENASYDNVAAALGVSTMTLKSYNEANLASINALRTTSFKGLLTTYTYIPLVGVSTITDPKGYTIYYSYDALGRLESVKDADGNVLSKNEYHYKN